MSWYYNKDGNQVGPFSLEELIGLFEKGVFSADDRVWTTGMPNWEPASKHILPHLSQGTELVANGTLNGGENIYAAPTANLSLAPVGKLSDVEIKPARFGMVLTIGLVGYLLFTGALTALTIIDGMGSEMWGILLSVASVLVGMAGVVTYMVFSLIYLHRCWVIVNQLSHGQTKSTPGQAVGLLFIPFFNLYWHFIAYYGWAQEYNRVSGGSPVRLPEGVFLTYAILYAASFPLSFIPLIGPLYVCVQVVISAIVLHRKCKVINHHANA